MVESSRREGDEGPHSISAVKIKIVIFHLRTLLSPLHPRDFTDSVCWFAHLGVEGNEHADSVAKQAAKGEEGRAGPEYLGEASLSHLTTEARSKSTREWIRDRVRKERRYRPLPGRRLRKGLGKIPKELAVRPCNHGSPFTADRPGS